MTLLHTYPKIIFLMVASLMIATDIVSAAECVQGSKDWIRLSPAHPMAGETIRIKAISVDGPLSSLSIVKNDARSRLNSRAGDGPPWTLDSETTITEDTTQVSLERNGEIVACVDLQSGDDALANDDWSRANEAYYSAWIAQLFDGPPEEELSFRSLEPVLRNGDRNFLINHLGLNEDSRLPATPDCADLPYFLRSYFAWKVGLPVGYRTCDRGTGARAPHCSAPTLDDRFSKGTVSAASFTQYSRKLFDGVHSGSARTAITEESTDFYPLALIRESLWPGTVYADPYGHTLILVKWIPASATQSGILLAADAQPDNSVTRKRFWEGNFLFADISGAGPGFKAFRPILHDEGKLRQASNRELADSAPFGIFSIEQSHLSPDDFYATMEKAINPSGLDAQNAYESKLNALVEQIGTRVKAVQNGDAYFQSHRGTVIAMPQGAGIFEATGPWEDFASPSRDMRLIIAMNVVRKFSETVRNHPKLFKLGAQTPEEAAVAIDALHMNRIGQIEFSYPRSDGSLASVTLAELFNRQSALEAGYNPNDCPEYRWGAPPSSQEFSTCNRRAPQDQANRMEQYRMWFRNSQRPTR
jgi:hypothetical protein